MRTEKKNESAGIPGSPTTGEPVYLAVGLLRRPHGVRGDLLLEVYSDFPERLSPGTYIYVGDDFEKIKITRRRPHNDGLIVGLEGVKTPEDAAHYRSKMAFVPAEGRPPLPEGEYYHHQIIGLEVFDESEKSLGVVTEIIETGSNDVYVVKSPAGKEILIPALKQCLLEVNLEQKRMKVHLLPGLLDEESDIS